MYVDYLKRDDDGTMTISRTEKPSFADKQWIFFVFSNCDVDCAVVRAAASRCTRGAGGCFESRGEQSALLTRRPHRPSGPPASDQLQRGALRRPARGHVQAHADERGEPHRARRVVAVPTSAGPAL